MFILRNKLRNQNYQFDLQNDQRVFVSIKFATSTTQLCNIVTTNIRNIVSNEKVLDRCFCKILNIATSRLLIHQIMKSKKFYLKLRKSMIAWLFKLQQKNVFVVEKQWRQRYATKKDEFSKWNVEKNELFRRDFAIYVFEKFVIRKKILWINHDDSNVEHFAYAKIENIIKRKYFWFNIIKKIINYVRICLNCQRMRIHWHKSSRLRK